MIIIYETLVCPCKKKSMHVTVKWIKSYYCELDQKHKLPYIRLSDFTKTDDNIFKIKLAQKWAFSHIIKWGKFCKDR